MLGAIIGDIAGSRFERWPTKKTDFDLFTSNCHVTDDSVMTMAVASTLLAYLTYEDAQQRPDLSQLAIKHLSKMGRLYPNAGYGGSFIRWIFSHEPTPYYSFGNGSAMRISPCGLVKESLEATLHMAEIISNISHNHPEGTKGGRITAGCVWLADHGASKEEIKAFVQEQGYDLNFMLDDIRDRYSFDVSCQGSVPQAIKAFLEADSYEQAIRLAISLGGDSDTQAAIAGGIAEAFFGIPQHLREQGLAFLDNRQKEIVLRFEETFPAKIID